VSARRRRGEDEFADERPWLPDEDDAEPWLPDAEDGWPDSPAAGGGRRGRHSAPGPPAASDDREATTSLPRQTGPYGRPAPGTSAGWEEPGREDPRWAGQGREDDYPRRREPQPPPSPRATPWDQDPLAGGPYQGSAGRNGLPGDRYATPASPAADPLRRPSGRGPDPADRYGRQAGGRSRDPAAARYRDPGGRYSGQDDPHAGRDDQYRDPRGQYGAPGGWDREASDRTGVPDPGGRYQDPAGPYGDSGDRPDAPSERRPGVRGRSAGAGDGYPPPSRGTGRYQDAGARQPRPGDDEYRDEYGERPGRDDPGWDDEDGYQQDEGWPFGGGTGDSGDGGSGGRERRKRRGRWAGPSSLLIVAAIILIPLIVGGIYAYKVISAHYDPPNYSGAGTGTVIFEVKPGDNSVTVGVRLVTDGVVASSRALVLAAEHSSNSNELEPGYYRLHKHMNAQLAWNLLLSPSARVQLKVTIPEGWRESQIVTALGKQSGISASDYTKALKDTSALGLPSYAKGNPEGYLFPATYEIPPHSTATSVLKQMVTAFNQEAASINLPKEAARGNLSPAQAIVVASLCQAEGGKDSDFPKIARVIYNRLRVHMRLDLDSTVLYALHTYGILASYRQLQVKSPYNTYVHEGLPPAPIDSPGNAAIQAALHPAKGNWLYFVTVNPKTKQTDFTSSPAVFQQLKNELQQNLAHGG
jgi:uncharacterized YceG family protein